MLKQIKPATAIGIMTLTVIVLFGIGTRLIFTSVQTIATEAQSIYQGQPATALISLIKDEKALFEKRNSAIWALGQIGDQRALPALRNLDTGEIQQAPYDSTSYILQFRVEKSIKQINRFSPTRWIYRWL